MFWSVRPVFMFGVVIGLLFTAPIARAGDSQPEPSAKRLEMSEPVRVAENPEVHYGFPRMVQAANGDLLLFYRVGVSHAFDDSSIALRSSSDRGETWSPERILHKDRPGYSAHNPVALVAPSGRVILWVSSFEYSAKPSVRHHCLWSTSDDHGRTWSPFVQFDHASDRSSYYMTEALVTSDGLLGGNATFPASGVGKCHTLIWHSADDGKTWSVRSVLTQPAENLGNEVALLEIRPGTILCLLRDRRGQDTYRLWSHDGGRTWSQRENLGDQLGILQRPFLTRLNEQTILLTGRDAKRKLVVAYLSHDGGRSFGSRRVLDNYQADGAYTTGWQVDDHTVLLAWYSDSGTTSLRPDIKLATLKLVDSDEPGWTDLVAAADLSAWQDPTGDWQLCGAVPLDPKDAGRFAIKPGSGVMVNGAKGKTANLLSREEYGDVEAHIEFVVSEGSNSGVYFQGRYEIQILDSWGVEHPKYGDCGGIYHRWDNGRGYEGHPPRINASLPPGQWQTFDVVFRAPRFDAQGRKINNARFVKVLHNGKLVHENVELSGPTRGSTYQDEQPSGPLMLQGNHGPVAFRAVRIRSTRPEKKGE